MKTRTKALLAYALLGASLSSAAPALAAPPRHPATLSDSLSGPAKEAFASAEMLFNNSDFGGALAKYGQAYELSQDPRLLFNMAVCARSLKEYARMQTLLVRYERDAGATLSKEDRSDVDAALAAIRNLIGALRVAANEDGASVAVDEHTAGVTPLAEPVVLDLGEHRVTVAKTGFTTFTQTVTIQGGSDLALTATLSAVQHVAQLAIKTEAGATIAVDGTPVGTATFEGQLAPGTHDVEVTEPGKVPYRAQVDLRDGETRSVQVTLESAAHPAPIWPWIVGGAAVVAGASIGGYFLFRSSQDTQAPLAGNLGTVRFTSAGWR
jgi:hypothetical protein